MVNRPKCGGVQPGGDPRGRVDMLLLGCAELVTRRVEGLLSSRVGQPVNLWDGSDGISGLVHDFCDSTGLTGFRLTPRSVVQSIGAAAGARRFSSRKALR